MWRDLNCRFGGDVLNRSPSLRSLRKPQAHEDCPVLVQLSSLSGFPRECAGSPFWRSFSNHSRIDFEGLCSTFESALCQKAVWPFGLCVWMASAELRRLSNGRAIACAPRFAAIRLGLTTHLAQWSRKSTLDFPSLIDCYDYLFTLQMKKVELPRF